MVYIFPCLKEISDDRHISGILGSEGMARMQGSNATEKQAFCFEPLASVSQLLEACMGPELAPPACSLLSQRLGHGLGLAGFIMGSDF